MRARVTPIGLVPGLGAGLAAQEQDDRALLTTDQMLKEVEKLGQVKLVVEPAAPAKKQ